MGRRGQCWRRKEIRESDMVEHEEAVLEPLEPLDACQHG